VKHWPAQLLALMLPVIAAAAPAAAEPG